MNPESKVTAEHLKRSAYLYIRQSTLRQVAENTESTERQYALRRRALVLGWTEERLVVIDEDQGQSGASANGREGFQRLVAEVGLGQAGIVMGLEVSRLARNCADWHRLLEICGLTHCLILDEDGLYDPGHYNDRLLLGLKGTMSEAELHLIRARMIGGVISKAQRGELKMLLPAGLVYDEDERVILDPDQQVQQSLRVFFATFERTGSARATVKEFGRQGLKFPNRGPAGRGELCWQPLTSRMACDTLHHPRYAGAFCYGRSRSWKDADGRRHTQQLPREQWQTRRAPGVSELGPVPGQPETAAGKFSSGRGRGTQGRAGARGPGAPARTGAVRQVRPCHDRFVPPPPGQTFARLCVQRGDGGQSRAAQPAHSGRRH
jgi:DNA invertase Pin-like site-specific DNA recombinase